MNTDKFSEIVNYVQATKPNWFLTIDENIATHENVKEVELSLGCSLPSEYVFFSLNYHAGYFAFLNIFSSSPNSEWYLIDKNREYDVVLMPSDFFAFSDDETGGYYGFIKNGEACSNLVYFFDSTGNCEIKSLNMSFFDFVIDKAFQPDHFNLVLP